MLIEKISAWEDVRAKAKIIFRNGGVVIKETTPKKIKDFTKLKGIYAEITSTTGNIYQSSLAFQTGTTKIIAWRCTCEWYKYVWDRSPRYKHLEGRLCSHAYALYLYVLSEKLKGEWRRWGK